MNSNHIFTFELRSYQKQVFDRFKEVLNKGGKKFHLVAPPGSGKTIMALRLLHHLGGKGLIFSPNSTIQSQWKNKYQLCFQSIHSNLPLNEMSLSYDSTATHLSLTYQSISVKKDHALHENSKNLMANIIQDQYDIFILDECHHLTGFWKENIEKLISKSKNAFVIGLTATPPIDSINSKKIEYHDLLGSIDYEIPLPAIVKEGNLAPYQDLVYLTYPNEYEVESIQLAEKGLNILLEKLELSEGNRVSLPLWIEQCFENNVLDGTKINYDTWFRKNPDKAIAFVRYLRSHNIIIPEHIYMIDEMLVEYDLEDLAYIFQSYINHHLLKLKNSALLIQEIKNTLEQLGYTISNDLLQFNSTKSTRSITLSQSKIDAAAKILTHELNNFNDDLRALILVDYEYGNKELGSLNTLNVFRKIVGDDKITDCLNPVMLTGRSVIIDNDLKDIFQKKALDYFQHHNLNIELTFENFQEYYKVKAKGSDWTSRNYVLFITDLLETGFTQVLISTRSLLGEGWDSIKLNTLIDLTSISSFVSVNQIRGRTIRKDPSNIFKCANNWDVVTIHPNSHNGLFDFHRLEKKHNQFYGISDDGVIEKGLGHIHPQLTKGRFHEIVNQIEHFNKDMFDRAQKRMTSYDAWGIGKPYKNCDLDSLELAISEKSTTIHSSRRSLKTIHEYKVKISQQDKRAFTKNSIASMTMIPFGLVLNHFYSWPFTAIPAIALITFFTYNKISSNSSFRETLAESNNTEDTLSIISTFAKTVFLALKESKLIDFNLTEENIIIHERTEHSFRVCLTDTSFETSQTFCNAVWECLGPIQSHRYIIERKAYTTGITHLSKSQILNPHLIEEEVIAYHPVPSILGSHKRLAEIFKTHWNREISNGEIYFTKQGKGADLLSSCFRKNSIEVMRERKIIWE